MIHAHKCVRPLGVPSFRSTVFFALLSGTALGSAVAAAADRPKTDCHGTEPFWNLKISEDEIVFTDPGTPADVYELRTQQPFSGLSPSFAEAFTGEGLRGQGAIDVSILNQSCSDGMSENTWTHTAVIKKGRVFLYGCCGNGTPAE